MKMYQVNRPFAVRANNDTVDYWLRLKQGAKLLFYDDSPMPCYQQTVFERLWPEDMVNFLDRIEEIPFEILEGENILRTVSTFNYRDSLSKRVLLTYSDEKINEYINQQAEEFNNREYVT